MLSLIVATSAHAWDHSWSTTGAMTFADFNSNTLLTDAQATDVVSKFRVISRKLISSLKSSRHCVETVEYC
jgi:hypothetical protein